MDIQELFARDPLSLTRDDISAIIDRMRQARGQFNLGNNAAGGTKAMAKAAATVEKAKSLGLNLDI